MPGGICCYLRASGGQEVLVDVGSLQVGPGAFTASLTDDTTNEEMLLGEMEAVTGYNKHM